MLIQPYLNWVKVSIQMKCNVQGTGFDTKIHVTNSQEVQSSVGMMPDWFAKPSVIRTLIILTWPASAVLKSTGSSLPTWTELILSIADGTCPQDKRIKTNGWTKGTELKCSTWTPISWLQTNGEKRMVKTTKRTTLSMLILMLNNVGDSNRYLVMRSTCSYAKCQSVK